MKRKNVIMLTAILLVLAMGITSVNAAKTPFTDVPAGKYYSDPVIWAIGQGITNGVSSTSFAPDDTCTRGQIVTFLWRAEGSPEPKTAKSPFNDLRENAYYSKAVQWAIEEGITTGKTATTFEPESPCTRGEVVTFLWRSMGWEPESMRNPFQDVSAKNFYYKAVLWAVENEITKGKSTNSFGPLAPCTRGEIVTFLYRANILDANTEYIKIVGGDNSSVGAIAQLYGELISVKVEMLSEGHLTVDYYPNGWLGSDHDMLQRMLDGNMDFVICQPQQLVGFVSAAEIFDLPMVFASYNAEKIDEVLNDGEFYKAFSKAYEAESIKLMHSLQAGTFRETTSNIELRNLNDFKGLKIRTMQNDNHKAFWSALGATPVPLTWGEVYITLQNGGLDAQENAVDTCSGAHFYEVQKYLIRTRHLLYCNQLVFNLERFNELPKQHQQWLTQAAKEAAEEMKAVLINVDRNAEKTLLDNGMKEIKFDDEFYEDVLALPAVKDVYKSIDKKVGNGLVDLLLKELQ